MRIAVVGVALLLAACPSGDGDTVTITAAPAWLEASSTATFELAGSGDLVCALDGGAEAPCVSPVTYTALGDFEHTFSVRVASSDAPPATATWWVDLHPPERQHVTVHDKPYVAYAGTTFRVVCAEPCAIDDLYLQARYQGFRRAHERVVEVMGIDVVPELWPVDLHLATDPECQSPDAATGYSFWNRADTVKPTVCLFELEHSTAAPPIVPRALTVENALAMDGQILAAHEYGHTVLFRRHMLSHEWLVRSMALFVAGTSATPCDKRFASDGAETAYQLCKRNGFRFEGLAPVLQELDALYRHGDGYADWYGETTTSQLRHLLDQRLGSSTFDAFLAGGYDPSMIGEDPVTITAAGGHFALYGGWLTLDVPANAVAAPLTFAHYPLLYQLSVPPEWLPFEAAYNYPLAARGEMIALARPVTITFRYDPAKLPVGGDPAWLGIFGSTVDGYSLAATDVVVDKAAHTVTGKITKLATYTLAPVR